LTPDYGISTKNVYEIIDEPLTKGVLNGKRLNLFSGSEVDLDSVHNDLEQYALMLKPDLANLKEILLKSNAKKALVSGSGSSVFGIFENSDEAQRAQLNIEKTCSEIRGKTDLKVFRVTTID